ncbi:MAG: VOC family protein, partial [Solirubrobacteraceae bacterium]
GDDVDATRRALEAQGIEVRGAILDSGVCHQAFFADPDGNPLTLHHRYAHDEAKPAAADAAD